MQRQGNYIVTYVSGTLYVDKTARVGSLWITDHRSLDDGYVALAFKPTLSSGDLTQETVHDLAEGGKIMVASATTEEALKSAVPASVELLDAENLPDFNKGWIWVKVPVSPEVLESYPLVLWKVVIGLE